jgi:ribosomal 30S subunit maturation factor RimM
MKKKVLRVGKITNIMGSSVVVGKIVSSVGIGGDWVFPKITWIVSQ